MPSLLSISVLWLWLGLSFSWIMVSAQQQQQRQPPFEVVSSTSSDVPTTESAEYSCTLRNNWSGVNHPRLYPGGSAHWTSPVAVAHNSDYQMWAPGSMASPGVQRVAERGLVSTMQSELTAAIPATGDVVIGTDQFNNQVQEQTFPQNLVVDADHTFISTITMVAPSPDWFAGFHDVSVVEASTNNTNNTDTWLSNIIIRSFPVDAGTEMGDTYSLSNDPETPPQPITTFDPAAPLATGVFLTQDESTMLHVAEWECQLIVPSITITPTQVVVDETDEPSSVPTAAPTTTTPPVMCRSTFDACTSNADCCSQLCSSPLLAASSGLSRVCRSAPKANKAKLSGGTRGGAAGSSAIPTRGGGRKRRSLIRGGGAGAGTAAAHVAHTTDE